MQATDLDSFGDWLDVRDKLGVSLPEHEWWQQRLERQHVLQVAVDVIAHAHNIPLRLLRRKNLRLLDRTFASMIRGRSPHRNWKKQFQLILETHGPLSARGAARAGIDVLEDPQHVGTLRDWILSLATDQPQARPKSLPEHYESWFLDLLPHLEREVWLTDMSNPHPAHGLARMVEHWSLFVLMHAWKLEADFGESQDEVAFSGRILNMDRLGITTCCAYTRTGKSGQGHEIWMLTGPFEHEEQEKPATPEISSTSRFTQHWFDKVFRRFVSNVARLTIWSDIRDKAPNSEELFDAFATRLPLSSREAERRTVECREALTQMRKTRIHPSVFDWTERDGGRPISRANAESIAALCSWLSRWRPRFDEYLEANPEKTLKVAIPGHRMALQVCGPVSSSSRADIPPAHVVVFDCRSKGAVQLTQGAISVEDLIAEMMGKDRAVWIESPSAFLARARERQHALWASQVVAIGSFLARHSRRDRPVGPDHVSSDAVSQPPECDSEDHLLRGYAGRVCQYLLQMTRADVAFIVWLDYGANPPMLRHVGGADRLVQHRAERQARFLRFSEWSQQAGASSSKSPQTAGERSESQLYRSIARADIEPEEKERQARNREARKPVRAHFEYYADPKPKDAIAVPLLVNGRVIGAFTVCGVSSVRQFDRRLHGPLRLVAQQVAQAMVVQLQLWHMRQLNWLASHRPLESWRQHDVDNDYNPLEPIARVLANIFLAPVVHVWLRDAQNPKRFKLHGYTRPDLLKNGRNLDAAPTFRVDAHSDTGIRSLDQPFSVFAIDQWNTRREAGSFVQASYRDDVDRTIYTLEGAEEGTMGIGRDYIEAERRPSMRLAIFKHANLQDCMSFALVDVSDNDAEPIGAVSLYAPGPSREGQSVPWPVGWRPMVAHIQTYLPYLLMQTEAVANPIDKMRRYLLHEGRNELNRVASMSYELRKSLNHVLAIDRPHGRLRPWMAKCLPELDNLLKSIGIPSAQAWLLDAQAELRAAEKSLSAASIESSRLLTGELSENLSLLARLIDGQRNLSMLGDPNTSRSFEHETEWFRPKERLAQAFDAYAGVWRQKGVKPDLDEVPENLEVLTSTPLWDLMLRDLVHNIAKYALNHEPIKVSWIRRRSVAEEGELRLSDVAIYDPDLDRPERLGAYGVQGSAGQNWSKSLHSSPSLQPGVMQHGHGIGLWGAKTIAKLLVMSLDLDISPRRDGKSARYMVTIAVPRRLTRWTRPN